MSIEEKIFSKMKINFEKLINYGFQKENDTYKFSKLFMNNTFKAEIFIDCNGKINGKVYDIEFGEEYFNFRVENINGEFVGKVKQEYENILNDIAKKCCEKQYFIYSQTNRIANNIIQKYGDIPEFPWDTGPSGGIFRNPNNKKWYALIMNINKNKLCAENVDIEVLNIKLDENKIVDLLEKDGFYKAYHMNKKKWISIVLDNIVPDEEIMEYIEESHKFTEK